MQQLKQLEPDTGLTGFAPKFVTFGERDHSLTVKTMDSMGFKMHST